MDNDYQKMKEEISPNQDLSGRVRTPIEKLRWYVVAALLGVLILAAIVACVAILIGSWGEITDKLMITTVSAVVHISIMLVVITAINNGIKNRSITRSSNFLLNSSVILILASFILYIFGIWEMIDVDFHSKTIRLIWAIFFALIHTKVLVDSSNTCQKVRPYVFANYVFIVTTLVFFSVLLYVGDFYRLWESLFGRLFAVVLIIDITLSVIVAVLQRIFSGKTY